MFLAIYMHQFGWLSERGGNFLKFASERGEEGSLRKGGVPTLQETIPCLDASWIKDPLSWDVTFNFTFHPKTKHYTHANAHIYTYTHMHRLMQTTNVVTANSLGTGSCWVYCVVLKARLLPLSMQQNRFSI